MSKKSDNKTKTEAQEIIDRIKSNLPQSNKLDPKSNSGFKPNARYGSINRSRR